MRFQSYSKVVRKFEIWRGNVKKDFKLSKLIDAIWVVIHHENDFVLVLLPPLKAVLMAFDMLHFVLVPVSLS